LKQIPLHGDRLAEAIGNRWVESIHDSGAKKGQRRLSDPADFVRIEVASTLPVHFFRHFTGRPLRVVCQAAVGVPFGGQLVVDLVFPIQLALATRRR
jgi:hypothetical protein